MPQKQQQVKLLCFESSCDDMSVAALEAAPGDEVPRVMSCAVQSQDDVHRKYGGIVPELASRAHLQSILPCIRKVLHESGLGIGDFDAYAATARPGLIGSLLVGHTAAKTLALIHQKPLISCHHLEGHLLSVFLNNAPAFPFLSLIVSGGHTSLYRVEDFDRFELLGQTLDDAVGEAFDKAAILLGLGFPGGPALEQLAKTGDANRYRFPEVQVPELNFSFSGLKSEFARMVQREGNHLDKAAAAAGYQQALVKHLKSQLTKALKQEGLNRVAIVGGVARNQYLRECLAELKVIGILEEVFCPPLLYCTDNAAMIGIQAFRKYLRKEFSALESDVGVTQRPKKRRRRA